MSLAFGLGLEPDLIGALSVPRSLAPRQGGGGATVFVARAVSASRAFLDRAMASPRRRKSIFADGISPRAAICAEEKEVRNEFGRIADLAGLSDEERATLWRIG